MTVRSSNQSKAEQAGPVFENPPVVEVALGIQFKELVGFNSAHFGLFLERVRDRYPHTEDQPRIQPIYEPFPRAIRIPAFEFQVGSRPQRMWFMDSIDGSRLLQVQPDRFNFNWRKPDDHAHYRPYDESSGRCLEEFKGFCQFCADQGLPPIAPEVCEVVYVNHIFPNSGESAMELFGKVFTGIRWQHSDAFLRSPEVASLNRVYVIGEGQGRLYAEASIGVQKERGEYIILKMTARVNHRSGTIQDIPGTLQLGHDWVVNGFVSLTDPAIRRERWRQQPWHPT